MQVLTTAEVKQVSGGTEEALSAFNVISGFTVFSASIGVFAQGIAYFYDTKIPGTASSYLLGSFAKAAMISGTLGAIFGTMTFFNLKDGQDNDQSSSCM